MFDGILIKKLATHPHVDLATWAAVRDLCCRTGNNGDPIPAQRWELFGKIWIEPYQVLMPEWSYVALADRRVVGYLTGCPDSASFSRRRFVLCTLPLLAQIAFRRFRTEASGRRFMRQSLWMERSVDRSFSRPERRQIRRGFPAHLHMNVDAGYRRSAIGTRLIERFVDDLRQQQIPGVHLFCGGGPVPFYTRMGFCELAATSVRGYHVHAMGLSLSALRSHSLDLA